MKFAISLAVALVLAASALAQDATTLRMVDSEQFGQYLADADGRPVYRFGSATQAYSGQEAQLSCTSQECLESRPLVATSGSPQAGEGIEADLLGTIVHDDQLLVTYNGWPLHCFSDDQAGEEPRGHRSEAFGGTWHLLTPVAQTQAADISAGETLYARACAQCHGRTGRGMASFPSLTGKEADYIASRLVQYRAGETVGPNSGLMRPVAARLSDEDIANLAAFVSTRFQ